MHDKKLAIQRGNNYGVCPWPRNRPEQNNNDHTVRYLTRKLQNCLILFPRKGMTAVQKYT